MNAFDAPSPPKDTSLIRTELFGKRTSYWRGTTYTMYSETSLERPLP